MLEPDFFQIWIDEEWDKISDWAIRSRKYYKIRSTVRTLVWFPTFSIMAYLMLAMAAALNG